MSKTNKFVIKRGDIPLNHNTLLIQLESFKINFLTLRFAQLLLNEAIHQGLNDKSYNQRINYYHGNQIDLIENNIIDQSKIKIEELQKDIIDNLFFRFIKIQNYNIEDGITSLTFQNGHFLRTKFINSIFEILNKYILKYSSLHGEQDTHKGHLKTQLQNYNWYIILYILRNNASHADGLHTPLEWPPFLKNSNKNTISWKTITVTKGMVAHTIRYHDEELLELFEEMLEFVKKNHKLFTISRKGITFDELL